jgi:hypothetical protein
VARQSKGSRKRELSKAPNSETDPPKFDAEALGVLVEVFAVLNRWYEERTP